MRNDEGSDVIPEDKTRETIAELKDAIASMPAYKSVTLTEVVKGSTKADASDGQSAPDTIEPKIVYKFDESGEKLRTDMAGEIGDTTFRYFSEGDDVVCETGGSAYSGTTEQFGLAHFAGIDACLAEKIGDMNSIVECAAAVEKEQQDGLCLELRRVRSSCWHVNLASCAFRHIVCGFTFKRQSRVQFWPATLRQTI